MKTNERFETYVNDIVKQNIGKKIEFVFSSMETGKIEKNEIVKIGWEKDNIIVISQANTDYESTLDKLNTTKYKYVDGYFSDIVKTPGNYIEVIKIDDKNLVVKGYRDGKIAIENKITLGKNKETTFSDHRNYYMSPNNPVIMTTTYTQKTINDSTLVKAQECYRTINGKKGLNYKIETTEVSSFNKKTNVKTLNCKGKATLLSGPQPDYEFKTFLTYNTTGKIVKVEYPDKHLLTITYK